MKLRRRALSVLLTMALVFTFMPLLTQPADAASKVQLIKSSKSNDGGYITDYTYNDKGLVKKAVEKSTATGESYDRVDVKTTTFKYNKKNKITTETTVDVETVTYYDTNKTTGKNNGVKEGSVTTTTTSVTKYTYKKGLAKSAVTTSTRVMSGSVTETGKERSFASRSDGELKDGRIIAGYNTSASNPEETSANAYYFTGAVDQSTRDTKYVTTYTDNGNGTYTETHETTNVYHGVTTETVKEGDIIKEVKVVPNAAGNSTYHYKNSTTHLEKSETTTNYTNKKKLLRKAESTTVSTTEKTTGQRIIESKSDDFNSSSVNNQVDKTTTVTTTVETASYSYKNGKAEKKKVSDPGVANYTTTYIEGLPNYSSSSTSSRGTDTTVVTGKGADCVYTRTTVAANGTLTETVKNNKYIEVYNGVEYEEGEDKTEVVSKQTLTAEPWSMTYTFKYDNNGNVKNVKKKGTTTEAKQKKNETFGNAIVEFGPDNKVEPAMVAVTTDTKASTKVDTTKKKGTKRLKNKVSMTKSSYGRESSQVYSLSRTSYKFKAKSVPGKSAKAVDEQQWILQNGLLNGVAGRL
jgi:hypothetical protein